MFLAASWHHIVITTGGFRQTSVIVLGLAFIYFIAHSPSAKRASLNCLFVTPPYQMSNKSGFGISCESRSKSDVMILSMFRFVKKCSLQHLI